MKDLHHKPTNFFPILRIKRNPSPINSPLDRSGVYLPEAEIDIDGQERNFADQRLDIGAELVLGDRFASDMVVLNINAPATYKANRGPLSDAEYFMIDNKPLTVSAFVKNNGNQPVQNKEVTLRVYQELALTNNFNASLHDTNYLKTFFNNEGALNSSSTQFMDIDIQQQQPL